MNLESPTLTPSSVSMDRIPDAIKPELAATAPGQLRVIRRNGSVASYDESKIAVAVTKAFLAVEGGNAAASARGGSPGYQEALRSGTPRRCHSPTQFTSLVWTPAGRSAAGTAASARGVGMHGPAWWRHTLVG